MIYYDVEKNEDGIFLVENKYDRRFLLKTESVFSQCNGYLGVRAAFDSRVLEENRGMFVAGLYEKAYENEVTELVNCPDLTEINIILNGEKFSIDTCEILEYRREINVLTGELKIRLICVLANGLKVKIQSKRFASFDNYHLFCQNINITPLNEAAEITITSGINGQITNSGVSEFQKIDFRVFDKKYMYANAYGSKDKLSIMNSCVVNQKLKTSPKFILKRRSIWGEYILSAERNEFISFSKYNYIESSQKVLPENESKKIEILEACINDGYEGLFERHVEYMKKLWKYARIEIQGSTLKEEAAICFAQYHLLGMIPRDTSKISVAAKGLTGEGYKGHVFWDTELFVFPFVLYTFPDLARNLLKFRYHGLPGAKAKAEEYGYEGAMYPWEVAKDGYEETPLYAALNIYTGKANKVWSGIKEHHVTADIIYALWKYYTLTNDEAFMDKYGYEMIFEASIFWYTRAKLIGEQYEILDIIGPDEYTEHVDNNAYTNYMANFCVKAADQAAEELKLKHPDTFDRLNSKLNIREWQIHWKDYLNKLYLPIPNEQNIIAQDDTFLSKKELENIDFYKQCEKKQAILLDYSRDEVVNMQVLKQADVVMLLNLFPHMFSEKVVKDNVIFYEARTIHDSSLSYCAHAQACASINEIDMAWDFFVKAMEIDINDNPYDSTDGIHAASLGGVWNCVILGFAGLSHNEGNFEISPRLPHNWEAMQFYIIIKSEYIKVNIQREVIELTCERTLESALKIRVYENEYELKDYLKVHL
jgi:hypothetical glycosyl hydrolase